ncbi:PEP/pyruvate-binding domain-containing protein [Megalodesulfovibrio gigas]|uniref:Phosphoenolpyruvate synthase n=1 Tax=Megalodesulfovibrio gigas (strain ATCC 19364 / DSM 1382 / NCIMB 9332 / VKM B-1759) TaxID=1121448 RepID=T2GF17_MEGG1|nr:PEP/pyruvate-binding domain-containing protein [Megalodesulfovibrio gigas]AGW14764.1 putative phosphoenolpyruvate synthase/pyruvate phosphate dikinase [Megalodesulfovibrio gigas DSM 1382 = ATCC 19364]
MADGPLHQIIASSIKRLLPAHKRTAAVAEADRKAFFRARYQAFLQLLESNTELLGIISELETRHAGGEVVGMTHLKQLSTRAMFHGLRMIASFETLSDKAQPELRARVDTIRDRLQQVLVQPDPATDTPFILALDQLHRELVDSAGAKAANLGELRSRLHLPTPDGFAVTVTGFQHFIRENELADVIRLCISVVQPGDPATYAEASRTIQDAILESPMPPDLEAAMLDAFDACAARSHLSPEALRLAVRSSALGEDGELSHAGQYLSELHVTRDQLCPAWKRVAASLYSPQALGYLLQHGLSLDGLAMCAACVRMVDAAASGVLYTRHPWGLGRRAMYVNAVWGLGAFAVEGRVQPDVYILDADSGQQLQRRIGSKEAMLTICKDGLAEQETPTAWRSQPCLDDAQLQALRRAALILEAHYGQPQDVEWAVDRAGALCFLQSRPLGMWGRQTDADSAGLQDEALPVLLEGGDTACPGLAAGPVFLSQSPDDAAHLPDGTVLVARHSSPAYTVAFPRLAGVITEHGSVTGHMASVSREFGIPTLVGVSGVMQALTTGQEITLDAWSRRIHAGLHPAALEAQRQSRMSCPLTPPDAVQHSPARIALQTLRRELVPLTLTDPKSPDFSPAHCHTVHDVMRYLHEKSYGEMFVISDHVSKSAGQEGFALRLEGTTGLDLHIIDLGGGLTDKHPHRRGVPVEDVVSRPFKALLRGLILDPKIQGPRPVHLKGFFAVLGEQMVGEHHLQKDRFGDRSYAIISDKYLNFSSRVGYHYGVLDCYCGQTVNKNYITFSFKGGAADEVRRGRRARGIALILERMGFVVETVSDRVSGRFQKYDAATIEAVLAEMGRLLQYTRQVDMLMTGEASVQAMADCFFTGTCYFEPTP